MLKIDLFYLFEFVSQLYKYIILCYLLFVNFFFTFLQYYWGDHTDSKVRDLLSDNYEKLAHEDYYSCNDCNLLMQKLM